jgi:signal-transduction protein with cAMP-binding, CBS, and nucleotidyltransferase domain
VNKRIRTRGLEMKVTKLMNKQVVSLPIEATIHDAAMKMKENGVGSILISRMVISGLEEFRISIKLNRRRCGFNLRTGNSENN